MLVEVAPRLFQADLPGAVLDWLRGHDLVISCVYTGLFVGDLRMHVMYPFADAPVLPPPGDLWALAALAVDRLNRGGTVLVHCNAGHNRSSLVIGYVLVALGRGGAEAVAAIHAVNPRALDNQVFLANLLSLPAGGPV